MENLRIFKNETTTKIKEVLGINRVRPENMEDEDQADDLDESLEQ